MSVDVRLRAVEQADLEVFFEQEYDAEANALANFPARPRERFMNHWQTNILGDPDSMVRTVTVDGVTAGNIVSWTDEGRRFVGYWLGREHWGKGVGTRALTLYLQEEKARPLHADPYKGNTGSVRLLEKVGFRHAGTVVHDGKEHFMLILD
ncbi:GNAT family N-acetyltransferase [Nonomuraea endophytica]|uniref:RimJ/RimL family protein N-acetyltransferase n=1 Tax=Nonomuraea endophytica TaxID=714136 RepID=A0A7W8AE16_9ACTN|nr:GNAT family protein [Nonomuraea endophytica]MBB5083073.1 RimJ/RimL family protein N-acetyltransferase [Nonomuraea endophytica]